MIQVPNQSRRYLFAIFDHIAETIDKRIVSPMMFPAKLGFIAGVAVVRKAEQEKGLPDVAGQTARAICGSAVWTSHHVPADAFIKMLQQEWPSYVFNHEELYQDDPNWVFSTRFHKEAVWDLMEHCTYIARISNTPECATKWDDAIKSYQLQLHEGQSQEVQGLPTLEKYDSSPVELLRWINHISEYAMNQIHRIIRRNNNMSLLPLSKAYLPVLELKCNRYVELAIGNYGKEVEKKILTSILNTCVYLTNDPRWWVTISKDDPGIRQDLQERILQVATKVAIRHLCIDRNGPEEDFLLKCSQQEVMDNMRAFVQCYHK